MGRIIVSNMVSLDGYFEGLNSELDWHIVDEEFENYAVNLLNSVDTILFGRKTYQMMELYWPTDLAIQDSPIIAAKMNGLSKIIFSKSLETTGWANSTLIKDDLTETVIALKKKPGKDMVIFGSGSLVSALTAAGLIDEYRVIISPVILGTGHSQFFGIPESKKLLLSDINRLKSGVVILTYQI